MRREVDRLQPRGAEPVELHAGDRVRQAGGERGGPGDVRALVAERDDHAEHDVVDRRRVEGREAPRSSSIRPTTSEIGLTSCSEPVALPRPRGVRIAS